MSKKKTFNQKLVELRLAASETQREVANAIGVSKNTYCQYEYARRVPQDAIKAKLANHFKVSVGYLFFGEE